MVYKLHCIADIAEREPENVQAMLHVYSVNEDIVDNDQFTINFWMQLYNCNNAIQSDAKLIQWECLQVT